MKAKTGTPIPTKARSVFEDFTVTGLDPLEIQRDGDENPIPFEPDTMIDESLLTVGDRVRVENANGRLIVVGRGNGFVVASAATADAVVKRDASGRTQFADPSADADADTKGARDAAIATERALPVQGVVPSSVDVGAGTATVDGNGTVVGTAVTSISLNGIHAGTGGDIYEYRVFIKSANSDTINCRLRASGTDLAGTPYQRTAIYATLSAGPARSSSSSTSVFGIICSTGNGTTRNIVATLHIARAGVSGEESVYTSTSTCDTGEDVIKWDESGNCTDTAANDGLTILGDGAVFDCVIKVVKLA